MTSPTQTRTLVLLARTPQGHLIVHRDLTGDLVGYAAFDVGPAQVFPTFETFLSVFTLRLLNCSPDTINPDFAGAILQWLVSARGRADVASSAVTLAWADVWERAAEESLADAGSDVDQEFGRNATGFASSAGWACDALGNGTFIVQQELGPRKRLYEHPDLAAAMRFWRTSSLADPAVVSLLANLSPGAMSGLDRDRDDHFPG